MIIPGILFLSSIGLTAGVIGRVNSFEDGTPIPPGQQWLLEWWAYPAISLAVLVGTFVLGMVFVATAAGVATGHGLGLLIAVPYGFIALDTNAPPVGALIALPLALFAWMGSNARFDRVRTGW